MPNIEGICTLINSALEAGNFSSRRFQSGKFYKVAYPIKTIDDTVTTSAPYLIDNSGEATELTYDNTRPFQIYYRIDSQDYKLADLDYGAPGTTMNEISNMRMVFIGSRKMMQVTQDNVVAAVEVDFPKEFLPTDITPLQLNKCVIEMGNVEQDIYSVWQREFDGTSIDFDTDTIMFAVNFKLDIDYNKNCFKLCN